MSSSESTPLLQKQTSAVRSWLNDFRAFVSKGNVVDMAIGIIIGGAFGAIVSSAVDDLLSPFISLFVGSQLQNAFFLLRNPDPELCKAKNNPCVYFPTPADANQFGAITINYGRFAQLTMNFFIVALVLFTMIRSFTNLQQRFKKHEELTKDAAPKASPSERQCPHCCQNVPLAATKCMYCISALVPVPDVDLAVN
ncbi:large-conductance mechanosensitive channel [Chytridium lagenaria]|nr:large-conductance mechanosensitive channel [Chytridium lagenaria]